MRTISCFCLFILVCSVAVCCIGCGGGGRGGSGFMVSGSVSYPNGKTLDNGKVTFTSRSFSASGDIISGGTYSISTRVPAGTYKVAVEQFTSEFPLIMPSPVDAKYANPDTSGITCEVKGQTRFDITVEAP